MASTIFLNWDLVLSNLNELADEPYQRKLWTGKIDGKQSNFIEAYEQLFGDSNLDALLQTDNKLFNQHVLDKFRKLGTLMAKIDASRSEAEVLDDPKMDAVRVEARSILSYLK